MAMRFTISLGNLGRLRSLADAGGSDDVHYDGPMKCESSLRWIPVADGLRRLCDILKTVVNDVLVKVAHLSTSDFCKVRRCTVLLSGLRKFHGVADVSDSGEERDNTSLGCDGSWGWISLTAWLWKVFSALVVKVTGGFVEAAFPRIIFRDDLWLLSHPGPDDSVGLWSRGSFVISLFAMALCCPRVLRKCLKTSFVVACCPRVL